MSNEVDLRELAIDRGSTGQPVIRARRNVFTRYVLPLSLIVGFLSLVAWASQDVIFPPKAVTVVPVFATTAEVNREGTPLFQAAGWIEPRPTPAVRGTDRRTSPRMQLIPPPSRRPLRLRPTPTRRR